MKRLVAAAAVTVMLGILTTPLFAQREVDPNDLKISPAKFKNASVVVRDIFFDRRAGIPPSLTAAGYTLDRYIAFALREAGMWCFLRRNAANEELIGQLQNGERITVRGTVRQPKAKIERGRFTDSRKFDMYLLEASQVTPGWE